MQSILLKSKLHKATVTGVELDYEGSLTIDAELMEAVQMVPYEKILVANVNNGNRFETYAIPAPAGSRQIILNGATAHKGHKGDRLIIFTFCVIPTEQARGHHPQVLILDENNQAV